MEMELRMREIESRERLALKQMELGLSNGRMSPLGSGQRDERCIGSDSISQCAKVLKGYRMSCDADVPLWFEEVEKLFTTFNVPDSSRVHLILPALTERVRYLLRNLDRAECTDYEAVKTAVLEELKLTPTEYLERFEKAAKRKEETWAQFASRVKTYLMYYIQAREVDSKEALTDLMVSDRIKASLSPEGIEYVRLREGESWLKPKEISKALQTFEQAKGKGRAARQITVPVLQMGQKQGNVEKPAVKCHQCHGLGHVARNCPRVTANEPRQQQAYGHRRRVQKVALVDETEVKDAAVNQSAVLTAKVGVPMQNSRAAASRLQFVELVCGDVCTEALLDTGSEMTVIRESILPQALTEPSGTVKLVSAFGRSIQAKLATVPLSVSHTGTITDDHKIGIACALSNELTEGVDCLLQSEDWQLLKKHSDRAFTTSTSAAVSMAANQEPTKAANQNCEALVSEVDRAPNEDVSREALVCEVVGHQMTTFHARKQSHLGGKMQLHWLASEKCFEQRRSLTRA
ncbi:uncharacterized protein LOC144098050 [Amblyomma americanum]